MKRSETLKRLKPFIMALVFIGATVSEGNAEEQDVRHLEAELNISFVSKYLWRGYDVLDDHGAVQPWFTLDLFQTGFSLSVWGSFALSKGYEDLDELDYTLAWEESFCQDKVELLVNYLYYDYPNTDSELSDSQEVGLGLSFPGVASLGPGSFTPSWYCGYVFPYDSDGPQEGWFNIFGLGYDVPVKPLIRGQEEQYLSFAYEVVHNDGAYGADAGISNSTASLSSNFEWKSWYITPGIHYQWSYEDTVNDEDEFWSGITIGYVFGG